MKVLMNALAVPNVEMQTVKDGKTESGYQPDLVLMDLYLPGGEGAGR